MLVSTTDTRGARERASRGRQALLPTCASRRSRRGQEAASRGAGARRLRVAFGTGASRVCTAYTPNVTTDLVDVGVPRPARRAAVADRGPASTVPRAGGHAVPSGRGQLSLATSTASPSIPGLGLAYPGSYA